LTETLPTDLLIRPPAQGHWSAAECLRHLLDVERSVFPARVRAFLAGQDFPGFDPDAQPPVDLRRPTDLARSARHAELGPVTLGNMVHEWAAHDLNHTVKAERALLQPFIAGSGPWRTAGYFADHDLGGAASCRLGTYGRWRFLIVFGPKPGSRSRRLSNTVSCRTVVERGHDMTQLRGGRGDAVAHGRYSASLSSLHLVVNAG
jgi:DinB superfamily